jgi:hypothetical protein
MCNQCPCPLVLASRPRKEGVLVRAAVDIRVYAVTLEGLLNRFFERHRDCSTTALSNPSYLLDHLLPVGDAANAQMAVRSEGVAALG